MHVISLYLEQGLNPYILTWKLKSKTVDRQEIPWLCIFDPLSLLKHLPYTLHMKGP